MPAKTAEEATWVRVQLAAKAGDAAASAKDEIVLRADGVAVDGKVLLFLCAGQVVLRLDRRYFRALTWFVERPTFGEWLAGRRAQFPNSHTRWTAAETGQLRDEIAAGWDWARIAAKHGRTVGAVKREAARPPMF
jgi:hypothetical protein